jgi:beta-glucosidase
LLKNADGILPLPAGKSLAVIGFGTQGAVVHGGGSGAVTPSYIVTPLEGIQAAAGAGAKVVFDDGTTLSTAVAAAKAADYALVFVGTMSHEGADRDSLSLDDGCVVGAKNGGTQCIGNANNQDAMVAAIVAANPKTIVVASVPGAILMPWSTSVPAVLTNFFPGQQAGHAIADVLFGKVNPAARLPITMPNKENETDFSPAQWPGGPNPAIPDYANYTEKLLVGYRYYARCTFLGRNLHPRMPLDHTHVLLKQTCVRPMAFLSVVHFSYRFTL